MIAAKLAEPVSSIPRFAAFVAKKRQEAGKKPVTPGKRFLLSMEDRGFNLELYWSTYFVFRMFVLVLERQMSYQTKHNVSFK